MITATSLRHPILHTRLRLAMQAAGWESRRNGLVGISQASGIFVTHRRYHANGQVSGFRFFDLKDNDITQTVLKALRSVDYVQ